MTHMTRADHFFALLVGDAERLVRRTPASLARLPDELHVHQTAHGRFRAVPCPTCNTEVKQTQPNGVMHECMCCGDGVIFES